tara:strand:- start:2784 stop:4154 length:1371 start_codon:yes stop_codon:yes gene_type:complete
MNPTEVITYNPNPLPVRIDKNFAFHISSFKELFGEDSKLIKAIIFYMAVNFQQKDLFGFYKLDPKEFCDKLKYHQSHLSYIHKNPFFLAHDPNAQQLLHLEQKHGRNSVHRTWSTVLENALYILTNRSFIDDYRVRKQNKTVVETQRFNFIDTIRFEHVKTGKTKKTVYYYKPNPLFEENLRTYFIGSFTSHFTSLRQNNLDDSYLNLLNRINNATSNKLSGIQFSIGALAEILNISEYKRFALYKRKVTAKFDTLIPFLDSHFKGLQLTWIKPSSVSATSDLIESIVIPNSKVNYENIALVTWEIYSKEETAKNNQKTYDNIFDTELARNIIKAYFDTHEGKLLNADEEDKKLSFYKWVFSPNDMQLKKATYITTYGAIKKHQINIEQHASFYLKTLVYISAIQEKHNCIHFEKNTIKLSLKGKEIIFNQLYELTNYFGDQWPDKINEISKSKIT